MNIRKSALGKRETQYYYFSIFFFQQWTLNAIFPIEFEMPWQFVKKSIIHPMFYLYSYLDNKIVNIQSKLVLIIYPT